MQQAYLALIDRLGLVTLVPEDVAGAEAAARLRAQRDVAVCWAVMPRATAAVVRDLLNEGESSAGLAKVVEEAACYGPVLSELHDMTARFRQTLARDSIAARR